VVFGGASVSQTGYEGGMGLIPMNDTWLLKADGTNAHWKKVESAEKARRTCCRFPLTYWSVLVITSRRIRSIAQN